MSPLAVALTALTVMAATACDVFDTSDPGSVSRKNSTQFLRRFDVDSAALPADGTTSTTLSAELAPPDSSTSFAQRRITFTASNGTLVGAVNGAMQITMNVDTARRAVVALKAPRVPGLVQVSASAGDEVINRTLRFVAALPESLDVEPSKFTLKAGLDSTIILTAHLWRSVGAVSEGSRVSFSAKRGSIASETAVFGAPTLSDQAGNVTVRFAAAKADTGSLTILARTTAASGSTLEAHTIINVVP